MLDEAPRLAALARILPCVPKDGWVLIEDEKNNIAGFEAVFNVDSASWDAEIKRRGTLFMKRVG
jgi:hypothetical protein